MKERLNYKSFKYYIWTIGCAMNYVDAERVAMVLDSLGFKETKKETEANIIMVLACSVRQAAIDRILGKDPVWQALKKKRLKLTILSGCVLAKDKPRMKKIFDLVFNILELNNLPGLLKKQGFKIRTLKIKDDFWQILPKRTNNFHALIPVSFGCDKFCSYCAVPYTRGYEINRPASQILNEVKAAIRENYQEITFLGQTVNSYKNPENNQKIKNFADLLKATAKLAPQAWIRFSSPYPTEFTDELIKAVAQYNNICNHFHLPVQSGSNKILKKMNRRYTREEYLKLIDKIRKKIPKAAITTDVIVGFPNETKADFIQTTDLFKKAKFDLAYIAQYSPRPGTVAEKMMIDNVSKKEKVKREKVLNKILEKTALLINKKYLGKTVEVLAEEKRKNYYLGKTQTFKTIKFKPSRVAEGLPLGLIGKFVKIKITKARSFGLEGKLINPAPLLPSAKVVLDKIKKGRSFGHDRLLNVQNLAQ